MANDALSDLSRPAREFRAACRAQNGDALRAAIACALVVAAAVSAPAAVAQGGKFSMTGDGMDAACSWRTQSPATPTLACRYRLHDPSRIESVRASLGGTALSVSNEPFAAGRPTSSAVMFSLDVGAAPASRELHLEQLIDSGAPAHRFALASFDGDLSIAAPFGSTAAALKQAAASVQAQERPTELYRNALEAVRALTRESAQRRALVLFSDGIADDRAYFHQDVVSAAREAAVVVFGVGYPRSSDEAVALQSLRRLSDETGGRFVAADENGEIPASFFPSVYEVLNNGGELSISFDGAAASELGGRGTLQLTLETADGPVGAKLDIDVPRAVSTNLPARGAAAPGAAVGDGAAEDRTLLYVLIGVGQLAVLLGGGAMLWRYRRRNAGSESSLRAGALGEHDEAGASSASKEPARQAAGRVQKLPPDGADALAAYRSKKAARGNGSTTDTQDEPPPDLGERRPVPVEESAFIEHMGEDGDAHPILRTPFTIGRQGNNDLVLKDPSISRHHAVIERKGAGTFTIRDMGALNGVIVNGSRQSESRLADGDLVELGDLGIKFGLEVDSDGTENDETVVLSDGLTLPGIGGLSDRPRLDFVLEDDDDDPLASR